ncbi:MAG TPA: CAP domain-containing protein [Bacteroidia bacterium]|jgi:hypothetical protein|nr:CAP domain-containing protein [Bacteroidia bacterium]
MKLTHFILGIAVVLMPSIKLLAQSNNDPLATWDKDILKQANTAASASYLSDEEKKLIYYTNLCRLQPKLFCQTVLEDYLKNHPDMVKGSVGLKHTLMADKACAVLVPDEEFCKMAKTYATKMGKEGKEGHLDFEQRMKPFMKKYMAVGENCDYGNELGLDAFMHLLIDQSDPVSLGHRKNLLDINFKAIGVAGAPHKTYRFNYVMDFGG